MTSEPLRLAVQDVRAACELVLVHLAAVEGDTIELERDYFWSLDDDSLYNVYREPAQPAIGQLSEAWGHLHDLLRGQVDTPTRHIVWLADVLRALGTPTTRTPLIPGA